MKHIYQISICFFILVKISFAQDGWFWQYPKPQGNTLHDIFIFDQNTAIAVGDLGTVIKTTDGGENWDVQHHAGGRASNLNGVHFINEMTGWAVGMDGLILKTMDGGINWNEIKWKPGTELTAVFFTNADSGWVVGKQGIIFQTTDGGESWIDQGINGEIYGNVDVFFINNNVGWIVADAYWGSTILRTTDGGQHWAWHKPSPPVYALLSIYFTDSDIGWTVSGFGMILKTTDGGVTWTTLDTIKTEEGFGQTLNSIHFVNNNIGWIVGNDGFILRTIDGGENWIYQISSTSEHLCAVAFADTEVGCAIGGNGEILKTINGGENWVSQRDENYWFSSIYFIDENTGWAVGDKGIILHTEDGGTNWFKQHHQDSLLLSSIYAINNQNVFAVGSVIKGYSIYDRSGIIFRTTNGGQTWSKQPFDTLYGFNSITFVNDSIGWISGTESLLKTYDKGITWHKVPLETEPPGGKIQFINENVGWIGGTLKTVDGGKNWFPQIIPITSLNSFYFINTEVGWAAASYNGSNNILKTTDGGENWTLYSITPPGYNFSIQFINETTGWISGYSNSIRSSIIIKTTDGGNIWYDQQSPATNLSYIYLINETTGWAVGDGILKTNDGGGIVSVKEEKILKSNLPDQIELFQNYPNPFNPSTTIHFKIFRSGYVLLKIYDFLGREVDTLVNEKKEVGEYKILWNAKGLPSGMYLYRLQAKDFTETKKLILLR